MYKARRVRLYYPHCKAIVRLLMRIFGADNAHADKAIEAELRADARRGAKDRAFIAENTYGIVRYLRRLEALLERRAVSEADWWRILGIHLCLAGYELPAWSEWADLDCRAVLDRWEKLTPARAVRESIPDWLDQLGVQELGDQWDAVLSALNQPAPVALRVNTLKANADQAQQLLHSEGIDTVLVADDTLLLARKANVFRSKAFQAGWVEVQDVSSQQVAPYLEPQPGQCVIDACAGGGGKTLHLAALMQNKGRLIAMDTEAWKLNELRKRARRAGVHCVELRPIESAKTIKRLHGIADRLLLDVPCSGLGVLRRNPDAKWKLTPEQIQNLQQTQQDILTRYASMLKPGGLMVYATCSILPAENERQVERFLNAQAGKYRLIRQQTLLPGHRHGDGFFMALLRREK